MPEFSAFLNLPLAFKVSMRYWAKIYLSLTKVNQKKILLELKSSCLSKIWNFGFLCLLSEEGCPTLSP